PFCQQCDMTDFSGIRSTAEQVLPHLETREWIARAQQEAEPRRAVEIPVAWKHPQIAGVGDGGFDREMQSVVRFGRLRPLRVAALTRPRLRRAFTDRPHLAVGPPAVKPQDQSLMRLVDVDLW